MFMYYNMMEWKHNRTISLVNTDCPGGFFVAFASGYFFILPLDGSRNQKKQHSHRDLEC